MGDLIDASRSQQGRCNIIASAQHILEELKANHDLDGDARKMLLALGNHLSAMTLEDRSEPREPIEMKDQLKFARQMILRWASNQSMIWDSSPESTAEFLGAVYDVLKVVEHCRTLSPQGNENQQRMVVDAKKILHIAMGRLQEEVIDILHRAVEPAMYAPSGKQNQEEDDTSVSAEDDSSLSITSSGRELDQYVPACLVHPEAVPILKSIAGAMILANYDREFCEAFIGSRTEALDDCLIALGMERFSIEDLMKMDWKTMEAKIKAWSCAIKTFVQIYLAAEKLLTDQIFAEHGSIALTCFVHSTRNSMSCLVMFGETVALWPPRPERLFCLLNAFEVLTSLCPDLDTLFPDHAGSQITEAFRKLVATIGAEAKRIFLRFGDTILSDPSQDPVRGGELAPVTRYVMNFIKLIPQYKDTLSLLFQDPGADPINLHLQLIVASLEINLEKKSQLYKEGSLRHIFLMNNIHYIAHKVRDTELQDFFGDEWIKKRIKCYQNHAVYYDRASWYPVIVWLRDERISGSKSQIKEHLKERIRSFYLAFDEVCKSQRGWCIRDPQLRDEVRISVSQKVMLAYQGFLVRCRKSDLERYTKYDAEDLEKLLEKLFEGSPSPRSPRSYWRR